MTAKRSARSPASHTRSGYFRWLNAPPTMMTGDPSPVRSNAMVVPSFEVTCCTLPPCSSNGLFLADHSLTTASLLLLSRTSLGGWRDVLIEPEEVRRIVAALDRNEPLPRRARIGLSNPLLAEQPGSPGAHRPSSRHAGRSARRPMARERVVLEHLREKGVKRFLLSNVP